MGAPEPVASGSLETTPFAHILISVTSKGLAGTLAVWAPAGQPGQDRIYFENGRITKARLLEGSSNLARGMLPLFRRETMYAFYEADLVGDGQLEGEVDVRALLIAGLRGGIRESAADAILARFAGKPLRVTRRTDLAAYQFLPKERSFLDMFRAVPISIEQALVDAGDQKVAKRVLYALAITQALEIFEGTFERQSLTEMGRAAAGRAKPAPAAPSGAPAAPSAPPVSTSPTPPVSAPPQPGAPPAAAGPAFSDRPPSGERRRPRSAAPPPPEPPAGLSPELTKRWKEVVARSEALEDQNYYQMLKVEQAASADAIRDAYFAQVKVWHPDRLPPELEPLRDLTERIFQHLTGAHETLTDPEERGKYLKQVQDGGGTPKADRELQRILSAAMEFQKVEVLIRRKDWTRAEQLVLDLLEQVPDEADYHAALGLIRWQAVGDEGMDAALVQLDRALELSPNHERALMAKARIYDRRGNRAGAVRLFEKVVAINPKNVDAQRQVRLAKMRGQDSGAHTAAKDSDRPKKSEGGLFGKLFGGKK